MAIEEQGISGANPSTLSDSVKSALFNDDSSNTESSEPKSILSQLTDINAVVTSATPRISEDLSKIVTNTDKIFQKLDQDAIDININVAGADLSFIDSLATLMKPKTSKRALTAANSLVSTVRILAGGEKFVEPAMKVVKVLVDSAAALADIGKSLMKSAIGIALFGLSVFGVGLLFASKPEAILGFAVGMVVLGSALFLFNMLVDENDLIKTGVGIAVIGLAIWGVTELLAADTGRLLEFGIGLAIVGGALFLLNKLVDPTKTILTSVALIAAGGALYVLGLGISQFSDVSLDTLGIAGLAVTGTAIAFGIAGSFAVPMLLGAAAVGVASIAVYGIAKALQAVAETDISYDKLELFGVATAGIVGAMILIGNPVTLPLLLIGAAQTALMSASTLLLVGAVAAVNSVTVPDEAKFDKFKYGASALRDTFAALGNPLYLPLLIVGTAQSALITASTLALSGAILIVSKLPEIDPVKFDSLQYATGKLGDIFSDIGGPIRLLRITAGAGVIGLVSLATIGIGTSMRLFTAVASEPAAVETSVQALDKFVTGTVATFTKFDSDQFSSVAEGIDAFSGISNLVGEIAKSVVAIGNLTFEEKELRNGKLVTVSTRQYTEADFLRVGVSVGNIITALTNPLAEVGKSGGFFSSSDVEKGIEALSGIDKIFNPLTNLVSTFAEQNINESFITTFSKNVGLLVRGVTSSFMGIGDDADEDQIEYLEGGISAVNELISSITDGDFSPGVNTFSKMSMSANVLKDSINGIDLGRLTTLNDLITNIQEAEDSEALDRLAEAFEKFAEALNNQGSPEITNNTATSTNNQVSASAAETVPATSEDLLQFLESGQTNVVEAIAGITELISSGAITVKIANQNSLV